jgi:hypothetical protein
MRLRRSQRAEVLEIVRSELDVELARAVAQSADQVRVGLAREADVAGAIDRLAAVCERLVERIDADREERRALADAIAGLAPARPRGSAVIGGSVGPARGEPEEIVLTEVVLDEDADDDIDVAGRRPFDWGG